jgi:hypothetical protein
LFILAVGVCRSRTRPAACARELGDDECLAVSGVEPDSQITGKLDVLVLVAADRDPVRAVQQYVCSHQTWVGEQRRPGHRFAGSLLLVLHHAGELAHVGSALQQVGELDVGGDRRLDEDRVLGQARRQKQQSRLPRQGRQLSRVMLGRHGVQVGHEVEPGFAGLFGKAAQRPEVVAKGRTP